MLLARITSERISAGTCIGEVEDVACGGIVTFSGTVRNHHNGRGVEKLVYECAPGLAQAELERILQECSEQYKVERISAAHRFGELYPGETAVAIAAASPHRSEAFSACRAVIEQIKRRVPIWKHEFYQDGTAEWVRCHHLHEEEV